MPDMSSLFGGGGGAGASMPDMSSLFGGGGGAGASMPDLSSLFGGGGAAMPDMSSMFAGLGGRLIVTCHKITIQAVVLVFQYKVTSFLFKIVILMLWQF